MAHGAPWGQVGGRNDDRLLAALAAREDDAEPYVAAAAKSPCPARAPLLSVRARSGPGAGAARDARGGAAAGSLMLLSKEG